MITLSEAARLCDINQDYLVSFVVANERSRGVVTLSTNAAYKFLDMQKIKVHKIYPDIDRDGEFMGMEFTVSGITFDELFKISLKH